MSQLPVSLPLAHRTQFAKRVHIRKVVEKTFYLIVLIFFALVFLFPLLWLLSTAFKTSVEMAAFPISWLPAHIQWQNFYLALTMIDFWHAAWQSLVLATISTVLTTVSSACVGFAFARLKAWGKKQWFILMLSTMMLPGVVTIIPVYVIYARLGFIDTYWPWVLGGIGGNAIFIFLFRQYFMTIPGELEEAAIMDGCSYVRMFWQIFLPLSKPVLATVAIMTFTGSWSDFLGPNLFLSGNNTTLAVALATGYVSPHGDPLNQVAAAGAILYILPVLLLFFVAQRYFIQGIVTTGLRG